MLLAGVRVHAYLQVSPLLMSVLMLPGVVGDSGKRGHLWCARADQERAEGHRLTSPVWGSPSQGRGDNGRMKVGDAQAGETMGLGSD